VLPKFFEDNGINHLIVREDTYSIVTDKIPEHRTYCSLCSRLRRGILYRIAREQGCEAIVLGHHREDMPGDLLHEPLPRRAAGVHAAEADQR
jgi:tRNA 2-thiocytidine biosynthesis protein TtcA